MSIAQGSGGEVTAMSIPNNINVEETEMERVKMALKASHEMQKAAGLGGNNSSAVNITQMSSVMPGSDDQKDLAYLNNEERIEYFSDQID